MTIFEAPLTTTEESQFELDDFVGPVVTDPDGDIQVGASDLLTIGGEEPGELLCSGKIK